MSCRSGCPTQDHSSWGECARAAAIQIDRHGLKGHRLLERQKENRLSAYESLRRQGIQPRDTQWPAIRQAQESGGVPRQEVNPSVVNNSTTD